MLAAGVAVLAAVFVIVVGRNDGSPLVSLPSRATAGTAWPFVAVLSLSVIAMPALGVDQVARTMNSLFPVGADKSATSVMSAVMLAATILTLVLSGVARVPTSVTLALIGASTGMRMGGGAPDWGAVSRVLVLAASAPVAAWVVASASRAVLVRATMPHAGRHVRRATSVAFVVMAAAYGANDGQKLLAVAAQTAGIEVSAAGTTPWIAMVLLALFALGTSIGLRSSFRTLRGGVLFPRPHQVLSTVWATGLTVFVGAMLGAPMSMTQSVTGALVGSCPGPQWRRIRWNQVARVAAAWVWTLPVSALLGAGLAWIAGEEGWL